jgi:hypothetical protein
MVLTSPWFGVILKDKTSPSKKEDKTSRTPYKQTTLPQELLDTALSNEEVNEIQILNPKVKPGKISEEGGKWQATSLEDY